MSTRQNANPELQPKTERRLFGTEYKRRMGCRSPTMSAWRVRVLLRGEGFTYNQIGDWRKVHAQRPLDKKRGPVTNPYCAELRRLETEMPD